MSAGSFRVVPVARDSWRQFRDLRLEMLADSPKAFVETLDAASEQSDEQWQQRADEANSDLSCGFAAVDAEGRWIGIMRARVYDSRVFLLGVYVTPSHRAGGVADAVLVEIERWAAGAGYDSLTLEVHELNERAQAFYRRRGFRATGETVPYPLSPDEWEIVMSKPLPAP